MAYLKPPLGDASVQLLPRNIVGRDRICELRLDDPMCSARHAHLLWTGRHWELHDLSSRNGTWVDGRRLDRTQPAILNPGMKIAFGNPPAPWEVLDTKAPVACVIRDDGERQFADMGVIALPSEDDPIYTLFSDATGTWWLEHVDHTTEICASERVLNIHGESFRIVAPNQLEPTREFVPNNHMSGTELKFLVGNRPNLLCIEAVCDGVAMVLENRAFHHLLYQLALVRQEHRALGLATAEEGWIGKAHLLQRMGFKESDLNIQIYRARRQLAGAKVEGASGLIERRSREGTVRLGVGLFSFHHRDTPR